MDRFAALQVFSQVVESGSFAKAAARLNLSTSAASRHVAELEAQLQIRIGGPGSENLVARKLGETRVVPCAAPAYLAARGAPQVPEDLARHNCFTYEYVTPRNLWRFRDPSGRERAVRVSGSLHSNNGDLLAEAA